MPDPYNSPSQESPLYRSGSAAAVSRLSAEVADQTRPLLDRIRSLRRIADLADTRGPITWTPGEVSVVITPDTGFFHAAVAGGTPRVEELLADRLAALTAIPRPEWSTVSTWCSARAEALTDVAEELAALAEESQTSSPRGEAAFSAFRRLMEDQAPTAWRGYQAGLRAAAEHAAALPVPAGTERRHA